MVSSNKFIVAINVVTRAMIVVWLQIIWSYLELMWSQVQVWLQLIWSQKGDYCGLEHLVLWVATTNSKCTNN